MMRVRFGELSSEERRLRDDACQRARRAWQWLSEGDVARASESLNAIDERIELALLQDELGDISSAQICALDAPAWPLAELLLAQAPHDLGCALSLGRSALPLERALTEVRASHAVSLEHATLRAGFGRAHLLELTLSIPGGSGAENEQNAAENLVRAVLGDRLFETWVGAVHVTAAPRGGPLRVLDARAQRSSLRLDELFDTVAAAARGVLLGLPELPRRACSSSASPALLEPGRSASAPRDEWTLLEVEPLDVNSRRRKDDLVLASTCTPELLRCYLDDAPCSSRRFSRAGEHFVFVSYPDEERSMSLRVSKRTVIESALSDALGGHGAVTGVGFGVKNTYVDLSLCNLEAGLLCLISKLRSLDAPAESLIRFFDSELADEWLSIWPHSPITEG